MVESFQTSPSCWWFRNPAPKCPMIYRCLHASTGCAPDFFQKIHPNGSITVAPGLCCKASSKAARYGSLRAVSRSMPSWRTSQIQRVFDLPGFHADGSEIRRAPVEVGSLSHQYLQHLNKFYIPRLPNTKREEVFGSPKTYLKHPTSGGIWKTRIYRII